MKMAGKINESFCRECGRKGVPYRMVDNAATM